MKTNFKGARKKTSPQQRKSQRKSQHKSQDELVFKRFPFWLHELLRQYFRLEVVGAEKIPLKGRVLLIANHSGFAGFDAFILSQEIYKKTGRLVKILAHQLWFLSAHTSRPLKKLGFIEAGTRQAVQLLNLNQFVGLFPEGEYGNFKPTLRAYQLQRFKRGFVRLALKTRSPILPCIVIGAEETHINLRRFKLGKYFKSMVWPLPLNIFPLPARWKIIFFDPIYLPYEPAAANDTALVHEICEELQEKMQTALNQELAKRKSIYF